MSDLPVLPDAWHPVAFLALAAAFVLPASALSRRFPAPCASEHLLQVFLFATGIAVLSGQVLGFAGLLRPLPILALLAGWTALGIALRRRDAAPPGPTPQPPSPAALAAVCPTPQPLAPAAFAALALALGVLVANLVYTWELPSLLTDTFTYRLPLPVEFLQQGSIHRVPGLFTAGVTSYYPMNQEVLTYWLLVPFRSEVLARWVQVPFLCAGALAVYRMAAVRGVSRDAAAALAAAVLLTPPLLFQAIGGPYNDVTVMGLFLLGLHACDVAAVDPRRGSVGFGLALGLLVGTKYVGVTYAPVLLGAFLLARPGARNLRVAGALALACAGSWYAWNWIQTGSPLYPGDLKLAGVTLATGLFDPRAFVQEPAADALLGPFVGGTFGLPPVLAALLALGWLASAASPARSYVACVSPLFGAIVTLAMIPQTDSRYLFPVFALLLVSCATALTALPPKWRFPGACLPAAAAFAEGAFAQPSADLVLRSLGIGALFWLAGLAWRRFSLPIATPPEDRLPSDASPPRWRRLVPATAAAAVLVFLVRTWPDALLAYESVAYAPPDGSLYAPLFGNGEGAAWSWIHEATRSRPATIAYAGTGRTFPLYGERLLNRIVYAPVCSGPPRLVHEHGVHYAEPTPVFAPLYAEEILRRGADPEAWLAHLRRTGADWLFVTGAEWDGSARLEKLWAEAHPDRFETVFREEGTIVYRVKR